MIELVYPIITIIMASYFIWKISSSFDTAASYLTKNLNEGVKGPTVNAVGSSLPELLISFFFLFYIGDVSGFSAGYATIIGSAMFNIALIPAFSFLYIYYKQGIAIFPTDKKIILQDGFFLIITEIALFTILYFGGISIIFGCSLLLLYTVYIFYVIYSRGKGAKNIDNTLEDVESLNNTTYIDRIVELDIIGLLFKRKTLTTLKALIVLGISIIVIMGACWILVTSSERLSEILNINLFFITFFIAAVASSLPDTILSVKDAKNKKYKDAFSNAYGSNIFDICIGIGLPVVLYLIINDKSEISTASAAAFNNIILTSSVMLILFTLLITLIYYFRNINLSRAILIISLYLIFLGSIFYIS